MRTNPLTALAAAALACLAAALPAAAQTRASGASPVCNLSDADVSVYDPQFQDGAEFMAADECDDVLYYPFDDTITADWTNLVTGNTCYDVTTNDSEYLLLTNVPGGVRLYLADSSFTPVSILCNVF